MHIKCKLANNIDLASILQHQLIPKYVGLESFFLQLRGNTYYVVLSMEDVIMNRVPNTFPSIWGNNCNLRSFKLSELKILCFEARCHVRHSLTAQLQQLQLNLNTAVNDTTILNSEFFDRLANYRIAIVQVRQPRLARFIAHQYFSVMLNLDERIVIDANTRQPAEWSNSNSFLL